MAEKKGGRNATITSKLISFQRFLSMFMISMLVILVFIQVILRAFNLPLMGIEEFLILPTIWIYMLGAADASQERSHISVDVLGVFITNPTVLVVLNLVKHIISLVIGIILSYWMFIFFSYSFSVWKLSPLISMPMFFIESALFVGIFLMTIYTLSDVIRSFKETKDHFATKNRKGEV